ncbi:MAG TPA: oligosaccharide flippase family protein, partial [Candidatus Limnocylindria bacterium]|nr:oligosaccharide flippase family protein [Candidatus Limnocylindria bacterium]
MRQLLISSGSLMASQVLTAGVGFLFWVVAAREFDETAVGFASASISTMSLLGAIGTVGMGTLLIREMPLHRGNEHRMLSGALLLSAVLGGALGIGFVLVGPIISNELAPLRTSWPIGGVLVLGSGLTAAALNMDQALIGMLRSELQLLRNVVAAIGRLLLLVGAATISIASGSFSILGAWSFAVAISLLLLAAMAVPRGRLVRSLPPAWHLLLRLNGRAALEHHFLNLAIQVPGWMMPLITLTALSAATNARFYLAWMLIGLASFIPAALTWTLYAAASRDLSALVREGRVTLSISLASAVASAIVIIVLGRFALAILGPSYTSMADGTLQLLSLTLLPVAIKGHYVT